MSEGTLGRNIDELRKVRDRMMSDLLDEWQKRWATIHDLGLVIARAQKEQPQGEAPKP